MKKIERISANEYSDLEELASMVYHNEWALVWEKDLDELEQRVERLEGVLSGDPNLTATKEQREMWRQSAVRYADKCEIKIKELEQQRDEAVKILISIYTSLDNGLVDHYEDVKKLLENVTGQKWDKIKAGKR